MEVKRIKKVYTLFITALPIISVYASGIPGFTLGDVLLVLFFVFRIIEGFLSGKIRIRKRTAPIIPLIIAIPVITLFSVLFQQNVDSYSIIIRIIRRVFYYLSVVIVSGEWFDFEYGKKCIVTLGIAGTIYLFIQYVAYYAAHIVLRGFLPFLPVYHENYSQIDYQQIYQRMFRPTSFLLEPAHISRYLTLPLSMLLFADNSKRRWFWAFAITSAVLATTSGIGIMAMAIIWFLWIVIGTDERYGKKKPASYLLIYLAIVIAIVVAANISVVQRAVLRLTNSNLLNVYTAGGARFRGYVQYSRLGFWGKIIGMGYGSTPDTELATWFSGASYMLYGTGVIGFLICVIMFAELFFKRKSLLSKALTVVFAFLFFVDDSFMSHVSVLFFSFICMSTEESVEIANENSVSD